jgi:hypothetical protein
MEYDKFKEKINIIPDEFKTIPFIEYLKLQAEHENPEFINRYIDEISKMQNTMNENLIKSLEKFPSNIFKSSLQSKEDNQKYWDERISSSGREKDILNKIIQLINDKGERTNFEEIEFLITEWCQLDGYKPHTFHWLSLWEKLNNTLLGNDQYPLNIKTAVYNKTLPLNLTIKEMYAIKSKDESTSSKNTIESIGEKIDNLINEMSPKKWEKVFYIQSDYLKFKGTLVSFFNDIDFKLPTEIIKIRNRSKTSIIGIFKPLHDNYSSFAGHMKEDKKYFEIVRILSEWQNDNDDQIYKRILSNSLK